MNPRLINTTTRPVELHLLVGTRIIAAQDSAECTPADLEHGQVQALVRRGVLVVRTAEPPPDPPAPRRRARLRAGRRGGSAAPES